jgi:hypothetical protein
MHEKLAHAGPQDGWTHTISSLVGDGRRRGDQARPEPGDGTAASRPSKLERASIQVLERPTPRTAVVSWSSPGVCHYGYQTWVLIPARRQGSCVLSGCLIRAGDLVYTPRGGPPSPYNAGSMMAAPSLDAWIDLKVHRSLEEAREWV